MHMQTIPWTARALLWLAGLLLLPAVVAQAAPAVHHDLHIRLFPAQHRLQGVDTLVLPSARSNEVHLRLAADKITRVLLQGAPVPWHLAGGILTVSLAGAKTSAPLTLRIAYAGTFRQPVPEHPVNTEDPTYGVNAAITPQGTYLAAGAGWYPDVPGREALFHLTVEAPPGVQAVTAGRRVTSQVRDGRQVSVWKTEHPLPGLNLSAGRYQVREGRAGPVAVYVYFYPQSASLAPTYLKAAERYISFDVRLFGPYPFAKFAVVENFFPTGYGFPSWTLLGKSILPLPFIVRFSLRHEIAHSWWGNGVRVDYAHGNWSEGLATYVADYLSREEASAAQAREYRLNILRNYATLVTPANDFPLSSFVGRDSPASQAIGYGKSAMVFHMARRLVGDKAFWAALRRVAATRMYQTASWSDFARALQTTSGRDMGPFFRQWVDRPGAPVLSLQDVTLRREEGKFLIRGEIRQRPPLYHLQIPLRLRFAGGEIERRLQVSGARTLFSLVAPAAPRQLAVDPDANVFRRLAPEEIPPTVNAIRGSTSLVAIVSDLLSKQGRESCRRLLAAMGRPGTPLLSEAEAAANPRGKRDRLFLGLPADRRLLPKMPAQFRLRPGGFTLAGHSYRFADTALFIALPGKNTQGRTALFIPQPGPVAGIAAVKIPHYGKYSYLVFRDGVNQGKGTWPVSASPTIYTFAKGETRP